MERAFSPKRLQKQGETSAAFAYYKLRYHEALQDRDSFLSSLYLDEIAQTLIIGNEKLSIEQLHEGLDNVALLENLDKEQIEQATLDIEVTIRKRLPGLFKETVSEDNENHRS